MILHLIRKDIRRLRTLLMVWAGLLLLPLLFSAVGLLVPSSNVQLRTVLLELGFYDSWIQQLFLMALTALVIQEDPLTGSNAFWMTRPISPVTLEKGKILFILTFLVAAPLSTEALTLALQGVTAGDIRLAIPEMLLSQMSLVILSALAAVITPHFGRFVPVVLLICGLKWLADHSLVLWDYLVGNSDQIALRLDLIDSRWVVGSLMVILLGRLLIHYQYRSRRTDRTLLGALVCLCLLIGVEQSWNRNLFARFDSPDEINIHSGLYDAFSIGKYEALPLPETRAERKPSIVVLGELKKAHVTPQYELCYIGTRPANGGENSFVLKDGWLVQFQGFNVDRRFRWRNDPQPSAVEAALGGPMVMNAPKENEEPAPFLVLDPQFYQKYEDQVDGLQTALRFQMIDYQKEAELSLAVGSGFKQGSRSVTVLEVSPQIHGVNIKIQDQAPYLLFKNDSKIAPSVLDPDDVVYALVNQKRQQAFLPEPRSRQWEGDLLQAKQPLRLDRQVLKFVGTEGSHGTALDADWLKDAVLVRLKRDVMGTYITNMKMEHFSLKGNGGHFEVPWAGNLTYGFGIPLREQ